MCWSVRSTDRPRPVTIHNSLVFDDLETGFIVAVPASSSNGSIEPQGHLNFFFLGLSLSLLPCQSTARVYMSCSTPRQLSFLGFLQQGGSSSATILWWVWFFASLGFPHPPTLPPHTAAVQRQGGCLRCLRVLVLLVLSFSLGDTTTRRCGQMGQEPPQQQGGRFIRGGT